MKHCVAVKAGAFLHVHSEANSKRPWGPTTDASKRGPRQAVIPEPHQVQQLERAEEQAPPAGSHKGNHRVVSR